MNTREKRFLFGGIGAGVLGASLVLGALAAQHDHRVSPPSPSEKGGAPVSEKVGTAT